MKSNAPSTPKAAPASRKSIPNPTWRDDLCVIRDHRVAVPTAGRDRARPSRRLMISGGGEVAGIVD